MARRLFFSRRPSRWRRAPHRCTAIRANIRAKYLEDIRAKYLEDIRAKYLEDIRAKYLENIRTKCLEDIRAKYLENIRAKYLEDIRAKCLENTWINHANCKFQFSSQLQNLEIMKAFI